MLELIQMKLILIGKEPKLLLLFLIQLVDIDGLQVHQQLFEEAHGHHGVLALMLAHLILVLLLALH